MGPHTTRNGIGLMDITEIDLRGLRMAPDGVTAALATMPPPVAPSLERRRDAMLPDESAVAVDAPTGEEFTTPWQLPAFTARA